MIIKKAGTAALATLVMGLALSACASGENNATPNQDSGSATSEQNKKYTIRAMNILYGPAPPEDGSGKKAIEERYNIEFEYIPVTSSEYTNKIGVTLASGDIPDLVLFPNLDQKYFSAVESGQFVPIEAYLNDAEAYPNLANIPAELKKILTYNDHIYGVPRLRGVALHTVVLRKDWLDRLGIEAPKTLDEYYEVLRAFKDKDPDGNGKPDTFGPAVGTSDNGITFMNAVTSMFKGGPWNMGQWVDDGQGGIVPTEFSPTAKQAYAFLAKLYREGIIAPDFSIKKDQQVEDDFLLGKAGHHAAAGYTYYSASRFEKAVAANPQFELLPIEPLVMPDGSQGYMKSPGFFGVFAISAEAAKDEGKLKRMLSMLDDQISEEGGLFFKYGVEGEHHTTENGEKILTELGSREGPGQYMLTNPPQEGDWILTAKDTPEIVKLKQASYAAALLGEPYLNEAEGLFSPTNAELGAELNKIVADGTVSIVMGQQPVDYLDEIFEQWKRRGGDKILQEMNEAWKARNGG
ncbi:sugar ABC transporter substrate-binding protein [Paenibacillus sp. 598K]|uniref:extracellular solute-binding protein n=1 Tax=Paenibacillus sp. 598K TaxID=1117987 RepID=UPI000FF90F8A|nr:extracellular solute-binding protein [Paenibacillus sp. 598K]GBF76131.1 sugar ABC transporter substrate-binding protein [Paenibacillus sp. 598K]